MGNLSSKSCSTQARRKSIKGEKISTYLSKVNDWKLVGTPKITKGYAFKNFEDALSFALKVGKLAEQENHHPDVLITYGNVVATLTTHAVRGLSENDFIMAAKMDALYESEV